MGNEIKTVYVCKACGSQHYHSGGCNLFPSRQSGVPRMSGTDITDSHRVCRECRSPHGKPHDTNCSSYVNLEAIVEKSIVRSVCKECGRLYGHPHTDECSLNESKDILTSRPNLVNADHEVVDKPLPTTGIDTTPAIKYGNSIPPNIPAGLEYPLLNPAVPSDVETFNRACTFVAGIERRLMEFTLETISSIDEMVNAGVAYSKGDIDTILTSIASTSISMIGKTIKNCEDRDDNDGSDAPCQELLEVTMLKDVRDNFEKFMAKHISQPPTSPKYVCVVCGNGLHMPHKEDCELVTVYITTVGLVPGSLNCVCNKCRRPYGLGHNKDCECYVEDPNPRNTVRKFSEDFILRDYRHVSPGDYPDGYQRRIVREFMYMLEPMYRKEDISNMGIHNLLDMVKDNVRYGKLN